MQPDHQVGSDMTRVATSKMNETPWVSILNSASAARTHETIMEIAEELSHLKLDEIKPEEISDVALFYAYLARLNDADRFTDLAIGYLNASIERVSSYSGHWLALHGGTSGLAWKIQHIGDLLSDGEEPAFDSSTDDILADIDRLLFQRLGHPEWTDEYDLISGLVGYGVYFLERWPRPSSVRGLRLVFEHLERQAAHSPEGAFWPTPPQHLAEWQRERCPGGYVNLGVAHGVPGVIYFLGQVLSLGLMTERVEPLLRDAVRWLLSRERPPECATHYDSWFVEGVDSADARLGWCYGDLGIGAVLYDVATIARQTAWQEHAKKLLDGCGTCSPNRDDLKDANLCHGVLGVAHIYNREFQKTNNPFYRDTAVRFFEYGLQMRQPEIPFGGYPQWRVEPQFGFFPDLGLLSGGVGAALCLLSAATPISPGWDRLLLLSGIAPSAR
jgi:class I lanthipeptide synthase